MLVKLALGNLGEVQGSMESKLNSKVFKKEELGVFIKAPELSGVAPESAPDHHMN